MQHCIPRHHCSGGHTEFLGQQFPERTRFQVTQAHQGQQVQLAIQHQTAIVDFSIEMDGQLGHSGQRSVDQDQADTSILEHHPTAETQVAVQPGVGQDTAIDLHSPLLPSDVRDVRAWLEPQVG